MWDDEDMVMSIWETCDAVWRDRERMGGAWTFRGTRVPIEALFGNINCGATLEEFLDWYEGVERWQAETVIDLQIKRLEAVTARENSFR